MNDTQTNRSRMRPGAARRNLLAGLAGIPAVLAMACAGSGGAGQTATAKVAPGQTATAKVAPGEVVVMSYQTTSPKLEMQVALYDELKQEYRPEGIEVEFINAAAASNDLLLTKLFTMHAGGTPPDMWEWPWLWRSLEGIIGEITTFMARDKIDEKQWIPTAIASMKQGAKVWGMPVSISADAMAYNLDLFERAGLKPPPQDPDDRSWTMDAYLELAKKLTKGTEQFGIGGSITGGVDWMNAPTYFGYGPVDLAAKKVTIDTPGFKSGLQFWVDLLNRHHVQPTSDELNTLRAAPGQAAFLTAIVATTTQAPGMAAAAVADLDVEAAIAAYGAAGYARADVVHTERASAAADAVLAGRPVVVPDGTLLAELPLEAVVDSTGVPDVGADLAARCLRAGQHVVMVNVEADVVVGAALRRIADAAGVVYTLADGDQPSLICELADFAAALGLDVVAGGKGTTELPAGHPRRVAGENDPRTASARG
jgi:ABC-type glycerol-3-phosphate transport system substrate-binding protein